MRTSYRDIKALVMARIRQNIWPPGTNLPGEIELADEFGCARATVNRAMQELVSDGILERKRKAGTRVKPSPTRKAHFSIPLIREEVVASGAAYRYVLVHRRVDRAPVWLRAKIDVPKGADMLHIKCMHFADGHPYQFEDRWINLTSVPEAADETFEDIGPNEWLIHKVPYTDGQLQFSASGASAEVAEMLEVALGSPVFTVERMTWLDARSVTFARLHFPPDYKMTTRF